MDIINARTYNLFTISNIFPAVFVLQFVLAACQPTNPTKEMTKEPMTTTPITSNSVFPAASSISLDGTWRFSIDNHKEGESEEWFAADYDDSDWKAVSVPHTWGTMPEYSQFNGLGWYRYPLALPESIQGMHFRLRFQAVYYLAKIWVNGVHVGDHEGGYTPFEFDVSTLLKPGQVNIITVEVDNSIPLVGIPAQLRPGWSFDWWNYGGIVRSVSLEVTNPVYISRQQIVAVPHLTGMDVADKSAITSTVFLENTSGEPFNGLAFYTIMQENTRQVVYESEEGVPFSLEPGQSTDLILFATLADPKLWHFDHPNLYVLQISLKKDGQLVHSIESNFGIRLVELKNNQMLLNGEPVRLVGVTRHEDSPQFGLAESVQIMAADYDDIKKLNEVLTRPVHYPQTEYILDYADRNGILLIPEVPAWQLTSFQMSLPKIQTLEKQQLQEMIASEYNHPSIWAWSIANEIESETPEGHKFVQEMVSYVKSLDPTRPVGFASNRLNSNPDQDATEYSDFVLMNQYWGTWAGPKQGLSAALDAIHSTWPEKTVIISEFGFEPHWNRLWGPATSTLNGNDYYFIPDESAADSPIADEQRVLLINDQMAVFRTKPFIAGAVFWTYQDYRTRSDFVMGVVDAERNKRPSWEVLREEFSPVIIDSENFSAQTNGNKVLSISFHTRGPIDMDMPVYTLRGYSLHWVVTSPDKGTNFSEGNLLLPTLAPAAKWSGEIKFEVPAEKYIVTVSVLRATGFSVIDRSFNMQGELIQ